ncbi:MAG: aromatic ring-hydroxylating dioxygenase subunit alpha [bacterium]|nr:(2Fe-2S)-binding protein [Deltaproteobacteria bacterium]MCP4907994.1 aromatic ring-hydroxylating dioxygenase subunit alpha [bacterium]
MKSEKEVHPHTITRPDRIPAARYYDREFYELECERLWPHVWQMACRLEEIPDTGDFVEYENVGQAIFVVRQDDGSVKAFHNSCRHRGTRLVEDRGSCRDGIVCPFHGWCWDLDGSNREVYAPTLFDISNLDPVHLKLRECRVELWGGSAFICMDEDAPPLRDSLEPFASFHEARGVDQMRTEWWYSTVLPVNWKLAMEAFMESYHVAQTHPQMIARSSGAGDGAQDGLTTRKVGEVLTRAASSDQVIESSLYFMRTLNKGMSSMVHQKDIHVAEGLRDTKLPDDPTEASQEWNRRLNDAITSWNRSSGIALPDQNELSERGLISVVNYGFPNFFLLPMYGNAASYRVRPLGPEECLFEIWGLTMFPEGEAPKKSLRTPVPMAPDDPRWPDIPRQDFANLPLQQTGLHSASFEFMQLSSRIEGMISNYQRLIDGYIARLGFDKLLPAVQKVSGSIDDSSKDLGF